MQKNSYPDMLKNDEVIEKVVKEEEEQFWKLRKEGEKRFHSVISQLPENSLILPGNNFVSFSFFHNSLFN